MLGASGTITSLHRKRLGTYYIQLAISKYGALLYIVGIIWILLFPLKELQKTGYTDDIDENALLPGQSNRYFGHSDAAAAYLIVPDIERLLSQNASSSEKATYVSNKLHAFGVDSAIQNFTMLGDDGKPISVYNAYGVVRAPRASGTEAILVTAPWKCMDGEDNINGISYALGLASFLTKYSHWSKDIVFAITDGGLRGTQAWLQAYHGETQRDSPFETLTLHGGVIEEGINMEFGGTENYDEMGLYSVGVNGQQPNADMVMTVTAVSQAVGMPVTLHAGESPNLAKNPVQEYLHKMEPVLEYMKLQALGLPVSHHAFFAKYDFVYKIEGVTIRGLRKVGGPRWVECIKVEQLMEAVIRCLSNLLERLHHSFWFYLMNSIWTYIPIAFYIAPVILLSFPLVFESLSLWWSSIGETPTKPAKSEAVAESRIITRPASISTFTRQSRPLIVPLVTLAVSYAVGFAALYALSSNPSYLKEMNLTTLGIYGVLSSSVVSVALIPAINSIITQGKPPQKSTWMLLKCFGCCLMGITLLTVTVLNPSLSVFAAIPSVPAILFAKPSSNPFIFAAKTTFIHVVSPPGLLIWAAGTFGQESVRIVLVKALEGYLYFGAWLLPYVLVLCWPVNLAMLVVAGMDA
ncbi:Glycosyl phosphatidyl inositol protein transamidase complex subunit [Blyttiomyces sp. JEL0837]|nr:Glycosyl phosphatidyl inositol protein transamidase complex subunit [Blyttiomyces sp. JEL0837]